MYGHDSDENMRNWRFGLLAPVVNVKLVDEQMFLAHRYRNKLVELERKRRTEHDQILRSMSPEVAQAESEEASASSDYDAKEREIKKIRSATRKKSEGAEARRELVELGKVIERRRKELKKAKARARKVPAIKEKNDKLNADTEREQKSIQAQSGLYWGNYLQVNQARQAMCRGAPPRFRAWRGDGKIAVQIQKTSPLTFADAQKMTDTRLRIEPPRGHGRRRYTKLWIRIGSTPARKPVWAIFPLQLHRMPPPETQIKWAFVLRRRVATKYRWHLVLSLAGVTVRPQQATEGSVSIDVGWRLLEDGLRVAYWVGDDGREGELMIPSRDIARWTKADDLKSIRDRNFNAVRDRLWAWIGDIRETLPEWFLEATKTLYSWQSQARLASVVIRWRSERFLGDMGAFNDAEEWRKQDKHLFEWQANNERKAIGWRNCLYHDFAAELAKRYATVRLENTNWSELAKRPTVEKKEDVNETARRMRMIASVGRLGQILRERFRVALKVEASMTTQTCAKCGQIDAFDAATQVIRTCRHCGETEDQDRRAALNIAVGALA